MKKITGITLLLLSGVLLLVNLLSQQFFLRLDLTEGKQYTLSRATKNILKNMESPVTVTAYFSEDLPPDLLKIRKDFQEMLVEYRNSSRGLVDYQFTNPNKTPEKEQEALQNGIRPVLINIREKDQSKQQKAFLGAVLKMGDQTDVIPVVVSGQGMEYALSTGIKKMSVTTKPQVGIIQGHGEPSLQDLSQVYQSLSILYEIRPVDLNDETTSLDPFRAVALVAPKDSIPQAHLAKLDAYLDKGGKLFIAMNRVEGNLQSQSGFPVETGLEDWLAVKGLEVPASFVIDAQCGTVNIQQQQGFFVVTTPVQFPYLPVVSSFPEHLITNGLEQVILPFVSPVNFKGSTGSFTPLIRSSAKANAVDAPASFNVFDKQWTNADFPQSGIVMGGILEGVGNGGKIILIGDGDFPVTGQGGRGQGEDNISLMVNSIDWLSDDTGLIELRTKGIATRPISETYLGDENAAKRNFVKYLNFGLPIVLVLLYGFFRSQRQRNLRMKRMQERFA